MISVSVRNCFISQWMKWSKHGLFVFPPKENPNMEKALFDWPVVLQYDVKAKYRLISRKFLGMKFFHPSVRLTNQKPRAFVSVRYQSNRSISVRLLFLFCSRVFISRSYEKRKVWEKFCLWPFKAERVTGTLSLLSLAITTLSSKTQVKISLPKQPTVHFDKHLPTLRVTSI